MTTELKLPSGALLKIQVAPFADAKALYQAILEESKGLHVSASSDLTSVFKDFACIGFSSKKIEACLEQCFKRCTYDSGKGALKIDKDTFEPLEAREDYIIVCVAVAKENILPFGKSLMQEFSHFVAITTKVPA